MEELKTYASYAVLQELNRREFRKKLDLFPPELRHYVILSAGIIGSENAKRVDGTPAAVIRDGEDFASDLLGVVSPEQDDAFRGVLETFLIETMKDELRFCCANCSNFDACMNLENLQIGHIFKALAEGPDSDELKRELAVQVEHALKKIPHLDSDRAQLLCRDFRHHYSASSIGDLFNRYTDIASALQQSFGFDYRKLQQEMISLNMEFYAQGKK